MSDAWPITAKLAWIEQVSLDANLSTLAVRLAVLLATRYVNGASGEAWPSQDTLAEDLGARPDGVRRAVAQLDGRHLLVIKGNGRGRSTRYRPLVATPQPVGKASPEAALSPEKASEAAGVMAPKASRRAGVSGEKGQPASTERPAIRPEKGQPPGWGNPYIEPLEEPLDAQARARPLKATRETTIPDDFPDSVAIEKETAFLRGQGWNIDVQLEAESFRAHAETHDRKAKRWGAAFHNWIIGAIRRAPPSARITPITAVSRPAASTDPWRPRVREFANPASRYWNTTDWGPAPGRPGCTAPTEILAEFGLGPENVIPLQSRVAHA